MTTDRIEKSQNINARLRDLIDQGRTLPASIVQRRLRAKGLLFCPDCRAWHIPRCGCELAQ